MNAIDLPHIRVDQIPLPRLTKSQKKRISKKRVRNNKQNLQLVNHQNERNRIKLINLWHKIACQHHHQQKKTNKLLQKWNRTHNQIKRSMTITKHKLKLRPLTVRVRLLLVDRLKQFRLRRKCMWNLYRQAIRPYRTTLSSCCDLDTWIQHRLNFKTQQLTLKLFGQTKLPLHELPRQSYFRIAHSSLDHLMRVRALWDKHSGHPNGSRIPIEFVMPPEPSDGWRTYLQTNDRQAK
jgi:hypothetical protein